MSDYVSRYSVGESMRLGPQIEGAVAAHAPDDALLKAEAASLGAIASRIASLSRPGSISLTDLDFWRDEIARCMQLLARAETHRVYDAVRVAAGQCVQDALFPDGISWVRAALGEESKRLGRLFTDAKRPEVAAAIEKLGLQGVVDELVKAQKKFEDEEKAKGGAANDGKAATQELQEARSQFDRKLDVIISLIEDRYPAHDSKLAKVRKALVQPLVDATARLRSLQNRGASETPTTPAPGRVTPA